MNVIGIGNYGLINSNYAKKTSTDEVQVAVCKTFVQIRKVTRRFHDLCIL